MSGLDLPDGMTAEVTGESVELFTIPQITLSVHGEAVEFKSVNDVRRIEGADDEVLLTKWTGRSLEVERFRVTDDGLERKYIPATLDGDYSQSLDELESVLYGFEIGATRAPEYVPERSTVARWEFRWNNVDALDEREPVPFSATPMTEEARYIEPTDHERCQGCGQASLFVERRVTVERRCWLGRVISIEESDHECCERCGEDDFFERRELYEQYRAEVGYFTDETSEREEADMHAMRVDEVDGHLAAAMTDAGHLERDVVFGADDKNERPVEAGDHDDLSDEDFAAIFG
jgi:ribosomal protein L37E